MNSQRVKCRQHGNKSGLRRVIAGLGLLIIVSLFAPVVVAQETPVTVSLNRSQVATDELVLLTVTAIDDSPRQPRPVLPRLDGLAVIDLDIATNVTLINGQIHTEVIYTYQLQPRRTGQLTIPAIPVQFNDDIVETSPLSIEVTQGAPPAPSPNHAVAPENIIPPPELEEQDFFVEALVDDSTPYIGQQLIYTFRFYQAIQLYRKPQLEMPIFNGFEAIGMPVREYNLEVEDRTYLISEIRTALFPKTSGSFNIGQAQLILLGNFFEDPIELYTKPLRIEVQPLPENAPPEFNGAVGQFEVQAWFSPQVAVINQPSTLSVMVRGIGNVNALPDPIWPSLHLWRTYDSLTSQTTDIKDGQLEGTRVYERLLVAGRLGDLTIAPIKLVYFDPVSEAYKTSSSQAIKVRVIAPPTPDAAEATATAIAASATATPVGIAANLDGDSNFETQLVNPALPGSLESSWRTILPVSLVLFWAICGGIPLAAAAGAGGFWLWQKRQRVRQEREAETLKQPKSSMHPAIIQAMHNSDDNYQIVSRALTRHLSEILGVSVKGLTRTELVQRLEAGGFAASHINKIKDYLAQSEIGRYSPKTDDAGWELLAKTDRLLFELDNVAAGKASDQ